MDYSDRKADPAYMAMSYRSNGGYAPPVPVPMEEETGCCKFSNQFYLMTSFGGTLSCVIIFQVLSMMMLGFLWPACYCSTFWAHLSLLSLNMKLIYFAALTFTLVFGAFGTIALGGIYNEKKGRVYPFLVLLIVAEIGLFFGAIFAFYKFGQVKDSLLNDPEMIATMAEMALKEDIYTAITSLMGGMVAMIPDLDVDNLDLKAAMEHMLKPDMVVLMDAGERLMKFVTVCSLIGLNTLYVGTIVSIVKLIGRMTEYVRLTMSAQPPMNNQYQNGNMYDRPPTRKSNYAASIASSRHRNVDEELIVPVSEKAPLAEAEYMTHN